MGAILYLKKHTKTPKFSEQKKLNSSMLYIFNTQKLGRGGEEGKEESLAKNNGSFMKISLSCLSREYLLHFSYIFQFNLATGNKSLCWKLGIKQLRAGGI